MPEHLTGSDWCSNTPPQDPPGRSAPLHDWVHHATRVVVAESPKDVEWAMRAATKSPCGLSSLRATLEMNERRMELGLTVDKRLELHFVCRLLHLASIDANRLSALHREMPSVSTCDLLRWEDHGLGDRTLARVKALGFGPTFVTQWIAMFGDVSSLNLAVGVRDWYEPFELTALRTEVSSYLLLGQRPPEWQKVIAGLLDHEWESGA